MKLDELQKIVYDAGIVGAGGAGFPTHRKFSDKVKQIVVNAAECEPLMMVDHYILEKHLGALVDALNLLIDTMGADEAIIGIKGKNMHLLDPKILASLEGTKVSVKTIPDVYPAGDEVVLTYETTGKIIPEGSIPVMVGVMVINVETVYNIYKAVNYNEPVIWKYITIGGDVPNDMTVKAPVGIRISELLHAAGYEGFEAKAVVNGGPMMGKLVDLENDVVTKTTKGLLVFPKTHDIVQRKLRPINMILKRASGACCNCTMCSDMCPRNLLGYDLNVHKTVRAASHSEITDTEAFLQTSLCCGCGVCTVIACQQGLDPQTISMTVKGSLGKHGLRRTNNKAPEKVKDIRSARLVSSQTLIDRLGIRKYVKAEVPKSDMKFDPSTIYIELKQHVGAPAAPTVAVGDTVAPGQVVAQTPYDALGTTMHSSIAGTVKAVTDRFVVIGK